MNTLLKKLAIGLALGCSMAGAAMATVVTSPTFSLTGGSHLTLNTNRANAFDVAVPGFDLSHARFGSFLNLSGAADLTFTFVGKEAAYNNVFSSISFRPFDVESFSNATSVPGVSSFSFSDVNAGKLNFSFFSQGNLRSAFGNGSDRVGMVLSSDKQSALLMFNDKAKDHDYDDMVIKVSIMTPVPEPETYALMLGGLAVLGAVARRRKAQKQ